MDKALTMAASDIPEEEVSAGQGTTRQVLLGTEMPNFAMRKFRIAVGGSMPLHTNQVEHEQYVIQGTALIQVDGEEFRVKTGDVVYIPALSPHCYLNDGAQDFEFLCMVPNKPDQIELVQNDQGEKT